MNTRIVMEHTSMYWKPIALTLKKAGFFVFVVNAMLIHDFRDNTNIEESAIDGTKHNRRTIYKVQKIYLKFHQTKPVQTRVDGDGLLYRLFQGEGANVRRSVYDDTRILLGRELEFCVCVLRRNPGSQVLFQVQLKSHQRWKRFHTAQWSKRHAPAPCCQCLRFRENPSVAE